MKKAQLMKDKDAAVTRWICVFKIAIELSSVLFSNFYIWTFSGDENLATEINVKLQELEERANHLDKVRTSSIQSISYINNRNRKLNVEAAEKAIKEEVNLHVFYVDCINLNPSYFFIHVHSNISSSFH